jgi:two-component system nitrate/nitrite sensor histidine kinase NarX
LQNHRLATAARQLAVAQERHLVAQGLHDSIAEPEFPEAATAFTR